MRIGCPRERQENEFRVALTPDGVAALLAAGHQVSIETRAGEGSGFSDAQYTAAGASVADNENAVFQADLVIKVKEPIAEEYNLLRAETALFCYLHLAAVPPLAKVLIEQRVTSIAFETITGPDGSLPLLAPMSMVAGRLAVQVGAAALQKNHGGKGILLSGLPGAGRGRVAIIGAGTVGRAALEIAVGMGASVCVLDISALALEKIEQRYGSRVDTLFASPRNVTRAVAEADLLIGAVLIPGAKAPKIVTRAMIAGMEPGSVAVDVAVDQGGCFETTRPTTHREPTYVESGVIHYAVGNMPAMAARTATLGLSHATLPVLLKLAANMESALRDNVHIQQGLTTYLGAVVHPAVAAGLGVPLGPRPA